MYSRPYDPNIPVVCMDEQPIELHADSREAIRLSASNHTEKVDHEYVRHGTCCAFMFNEPLGGWRRVSVSERRTKTDWARQIRKLVDEDYPDASRIVLVCDNLNTHSMSSLYEAFAPSEARRIIGKDRTSPYPEARFLAGYGGMRAFSVLEAVSVEEHRFNGEASTRIRSVVH